MEEEPLDRRMGNGERESRAQLPVDPPQPCPHRDLWSRRPRPRIQRHRQRFCKFSLSITLSLISYDNKIGSVFHVTF